MNHKLNIFILLILNSIYKCVNSQYLRGYNNFCTMDNYIKDNYINTQLYFMLNIFGFSIFFFMLLFYITIIFNNPQKYDLPI